MHNFLPIQWPSTDTAGRNRAGASGERRFPKQAEAAVARSFSAPPGNDSRGLGHRVEPSPKRGQGRFPDARKGNPPAISPVAAGPYRTKGAAAMSSAALGFIRFYQACLSPVLPSSCRFYPSCSAYAYEAIEKWGVRRGAGLALRRLLRCRPFGGHGYDPVPLEDYSSTQTAKSS